MREKHFSLDAEEIEDVTIVWSECGYKLIEVKLKNGESYLVESN